MNFKPVRTFTDSEDREWTIELDRRTRTRIRRDHQVDLSCDGLQAILEAVVQDMEAKKPEWFVDLVYQICKPQADELGVTHWQFLRTISLVPAVDALFEAAGDLVDEERAILSRKNTNE